MGLLAQHQLFQYIDTHLAQYQEQIRALQTTLESLPEVDHRMQAEILVSHLQPWHVQTKLLDMGRHIVYTEYASGASRALLRYIPASSPGYLIQVLYDILALLIGQPAIHHCRYRPLHNCSSISFQGKSQKIFFRSFSATCRYRDLLTSRYGYSMPIVLSHWIAIMPLLRRYRRHIATPIALNLLYFRSAREDTR